jgi:hypothetical protein
MSRIVLVLCAAALLLPALAPAKATTSSSRNAQIIRAVFKGYGEQAIRVSRCESGLTTWARNGQYLGLFQMGSSERRIYGHGADAWAQTRAAYHYFVDSGRDWSPWSCKPW